MAELAVLHRFQLGDVCAYTDGQAPTLAKPLVVMFHGAFRDSSALSRWPPLLKGAADVMLIDLPGHGGSAAIEDPTIDRMALAVAPAVRQITTPRSAVLFVGESIGALVALALHRSMQPAMPTALLLADPPMSVAKLWNVQIGMRELWASRESPRWQAVARAVFGYEPEHQREILYYDLFRELRAPATIVSGDVPLFPPRPLADANRVFDDVDRFVVSEITGGRVSIRTAPDCGHLVLIQGQAVCLDIMLTMLGELTAGGG